MQLADFEFELPDELIAQYPAPERTDSRLLCVDGKKRQLVDRSFPDILDLLKPGDALVLNDTRVIPARLRGAKASGGRVEVLVERRLDEHRFLAQARASKSPRSGSTIVIDGHAVEVCGRRHDLFELRSAIPVRELLEECGDIPLPPYIDRVSEVLDEERYQTVYASRDGAVAAPTAGLHFDTALLERVRAAGIETVFVTLHVGAGTFQPVRTDRIEDHRLHDEYAELSRQACDRLTAVRERGGRVVAVGTTSVRTLEAAAQGGKLTPFRGATDLFIYPGYRFCYVDALITNFHLPGSTLLMLVAAFIDLDLLMQAYRHAVANRYRFYSYGDAMFVTRQ